MKKLTPIPGHERMLFPLLHAASDDEVHSVRELAGVIAEHFSIPKAVRSETRLDGRTNLIHRIEWARTYLKKAGLVFYPSVGLFKITSKGLAMLEQNLTETEFLQKYRSFLASERGQPGSA